jgi:hypothetical protein
VNLLDYPRPRGDTGIGFHWFPDYRHYERRYFDIFIPELKAMGGSWLVLLSEGLTPIPDWFLRGLIEQNIEPIIRIYTPFVTFIDQAGLRRVCQHYAGLGAHYVHVFNEPNLKIEWAEWNSEGLPARFMDFLIPCLETMYKVEEIIPVFTPLSPGGNYWDTSFLKTALAVMNQRGKKYLYDKMAVGIHNYAFNKPLTWGKGGSTRWSCAKPYQRIPGCEDHTGFYQFEWYDEIIRQRTGRRLPLIGCENGVRPGDADDPRSPAINGALHAERSAAMCEMMMNGEVPYYFFNNAFWLLAAEDENPFAHHRWYRPNGEPGLQQSVARLKALPKTERPIRAHLPNEIRVLMSDGGVRVMSLEEYLRGVLPREMGDDAPMEALKAQAVAARCYASVAVEKPRHGAEGADICTTTHCQVWSPQTYPNTDQAVQETRGTVAMHGDEIIQAFYFGHCDGHTRNSEDVWVRALPYCRSVPCVKPYPSMYGHGVGMCQRGAMAMAEQGATCVDILTHYYTGIQIIGADMVPVDTWQEVRTGYADWPRPHADNGLGIHGGLDLSDEALAEDVARVEHLNVKWVMLVVENETELQRAASAYWRKGVMPVVRPKCMIDEDHDFVSDARLLSDVGIPAYVQIYNAPEQDDEWRTEGADVAVFTSRWLTEASAVIEAGAYPGLQVNRIEDLKVVIAEAKRQGLEHIFRHAWFCCHNHGENRPARYPYDDINQSGLPVQHPEWAFAGSIEEVNRWRHEGKQPGQDIYEAYDCVLGFLAFARVFEEELGFVPPFICGEGGWVCGDLSDPRYPKVSDYLHRAHHVAMFSWFRDGVLSDGSPLPEYLFAVCPWVLSGTNDPAAWCDGPYGTRDETIAAVASMSDFTRDGIPVERPAPSSPAPLTPQPTPERPKSGWRMTVDRRPRSDGVRAIAGNFPRSGIRLDVSDPWGNTVSVTSGSKTEYGPGGFEVLVWADAAYTLRFLDKVFQVEVSREIVILTFSEDGTGDAVEANVRLVTNWMDPGRVEGLLQDLGRYEGLLTMEEQ